MKFSTYANTVNLSILELNYTSKLFSKPPCLIAKIKLEKSVQLEAQETVVHARGRFNCKNKIGKNLYS